jgi:hypothetical protein
MTGVSVGVATLASAGEAPLTADTATDTTDVTVIAPMYGSALPLGR